MKGFKFCIIIFVFLITCLFYPRLSWAADINGNINVIENRTKIIHPVFSFNFSPRGIPAIAYYNLTTKKLVFAKIEKGKWIFENVAPVGVSRHGLTCSLQFDEAETPYITFYSEDENLKLARKIGEEWIIEEVDNTRNSGHFNNLFVKDDKNIYISYQAPGGTMLARKNQLNWEKSKVDKPGKKSRVHTAENGEISVFYQVADENNPGMLQLNRGIFQNGEWFKNRVNQSDNCIDFDIALDKKDTPLISYICDNDIYVFKETLPGSGIWNEEKVSGEKAEQVSIASFKNGFPIISYVTGNKKELKVAVYDGANWDNKAVATSRFKYLFNMSRVAVNRNDVPLIVLHDNESLNVLVQKDKTWNIGWIDGTERLGGYLNYIVRPSGLNMASYYNFTRRQLHFAFYRNNKWEVDIVDSLGNVGADCSLAVDGESIPSIAYYDKSNGDLKFAWKKDEYWRWERVDFNFNTGAFPSLSFDRQSIPHISYYNFTTSFLKYAQKIDGKWKRDRIVKLGDYGGESILMLKPGGEIFVVYTDGKKVQNPEKDESPVMTYIKLAKKTGGDWKRNILAGPYAVDINNSGLSGDISGKGEIAIAYIDRESNLQVAVGDSIDPEQWKIFKVASNCWGDTSVRFLSDNNLSVLYLTGKNRDSAKLYLAGFNGKDWAVTPVETGNHKPENFHLGGMIKNKINFAFQDREDSVVYEFRQK
ncbi:MAG: hypothetical protein ACLFQV_04015 [Vulcanimicrobiota bacterium]